MRKFLAGLAGLLGVAIWVISAKSEQRKTENKRLKQEKQLAQENIAQKQREEKAVNELQQKHREEQVNVQKRINEGDRNQLDNDW